MSNAISSLKIAPSLSLAAVVLASTQLTFADQIVRPQESCGRWATHTTQDNLAEGRLFFSPDSRNHKSVIMHTNADSKTMPVKKWELNQNGNIIQGEISFQSQLSFFSNNRDGNPICLKIFFRDFETGKLIPNDSPKTPNVESTVLHFFVREQHMRRRHNNTLRFRIVFTNIMPLVTNNPRVIRLDIAVPTAEDEHLDVVTLQEVEGGLIALEKI